MSLVIRCDKKFEWLYVFPFQPRWHIWAAQATKWTKAIPSRPRKETITQNRQIDDPPGIQTLARMNMLEMTVTTCTTMNLYHIFIKLEMDSCMFRNMLHAFYVFSTTLPTIYFYSNEKSNRTHYNKNKWISLVNIYVGLMFWSLSIHLVCILFLTLKFDAWSLISDIQSSIVLHISCIILILHTYCSSLLCSKHIFFV